jgi:hypothetical protein
VVRRLSIRPMSASLLPMQLSRFQAVKRTLPQKAQGDRRYYNEDVGVLMTAGEKKVHNN